MAILAIAVERVVLRPLVNQPDIILFMATFGLTFIIIGLGEFIFGGEPKQMIAEELGLPQGTMRFDILGGKVIIQKIDVAAAVIASLMIAALALFFQYTRIGRALRAVADSHKAALSVGISLNQIWAIVWFAAGIVALITGIMWGARSDVSFALQVIALKALPVLILGGFTSIPVRLSAGSSSASARSSQSFTGARWWAAASRTGCLCDRARLPDGATARAVRRQDHREDLTHVLSGIRPVQEDLLR